MYGPDLGKAVYELKHMSFIVQATASQVLFGTTGAQKNASAFALTIPGFSELLQALSENSEVIKRKKELFEDIFEGGNIISKLISREHIRSTRKVPSVFIV